MGILDLFKPQQSIPTVNGILPDAAKQEILCARLPILNTNKLFIKNGEQCHYIEKAIYEKRDVKKKYIRNGIGYSIPGLFKGTRIHFNNGQTKTVDDVQCEMIRGILYITNMRTIFVGKNIGFDRSVNDIVALTPYANCVELQFAKGRYKIFVPDGNITNAVLQLINRGGKNGRIT